MTITVTPEPLNAPPRNTVAVSVPAGSVMSSVAVWRNDFNGRTLLRSQPAAGFDSRTVFDYESPYGTPVTYDWTAEYTDPTAYTTLFNELWASTAAWTVTTGTWNVSGGKLRNTSSTAGLSRLITSSRYRITLSSLSAVMGGGFGTSGELVIAEGNQTEPYAGGRLILTYESSSATFSITAEAPGASPTVTVVPIDPSQPIVMDFFPTTISVTGAGGSKSYPYSFNVGYVGFKAVAFGANDVQFGAVKVQGYSASGTIAETSVPVTLLPSDAWLVNVATPALSFPLSGTDPFKAGIDYIDPVINPTNTTQHQILGTDRVLPVTTGPRGDDETELGIYTATNAERIALRALLKPDIPILVNIPENWGYEFESGFYSIGNVESARQADPRHGVSMRRAKLPMVRVSSPVVAVENSGWSYAAVAVEFANYTAVKTAFATYADLASNTRI